MTRTQPKVRFFFEGLLLWGLLLFPLTFRHLARAAALIRDSPAGEMRRLPALIGKTFWPLAFAQRAF